ncbi:MAG: prolyl oligopeptidase family serine peptidase [Candidatus Woesebacteria bacterium]|jgi:prolyl oligopeptidase
MSDAGDLTDHAVEAHCASGGFDWLEDDFLRTEMWLRDQSARLRGFVGRLGDGEGSFKRELCNTPYPYYSSPAAVRAGAAYLFSRYCLYKCEPDGEIEMVLDMHDIAVSAGGDQAMAAGCSVSSDGNFVAILVSVSGREEQAILVYDLNNNRIANDGMSGLSLRIPNVEWCDEDGFFYSWADSSSASMDVLRVYWHQLGTHFSEDEPVSNLPYLCGEIDRRLFGEWMIVRDISLAVNLHYVAAYNIKTSELRILANQLKQQSEGWIVDDVVYLLANDESGRRCLMATPFCAKMPPLSQWQKVIFEESSTLKRVYFVAGGMVAHYQKEFEDVLVLCDRDGAYLSRIEIPDACRVDVVEGDLDAGDFWFFVRGFYETLRLYRYEIANRNLKLVDTCEGELDHKEYFVTRHLITSPVDGVTVPLAVVHHCGVVLDENNPVVLSGYGGVGGTVKLSAIRHYKSLLDRGVVIARVCLRGDGGKGSQWADAGTGADKKCNTISDFLAAAEFMRTHYTRDRLAVVGMSNGGLTVAASVVMRPKLFKCAVFGHTVLDMRRLLVITAMFGGYKAHYGDPSDPAQWNSMKTWCPYGNLRADVRYPPMLVFQSSGDQIVGPAHGWKFVTRLQALKNDCLLSAPSKAGHAQTFDDVALEMLFIAHHLGVDV